MRRTMSMRAYRTLLRLLPPDVREPFGDDMEEIFRRRLEQSDGPFGAAAVWGRAVVDIGIRAVTMRIEDERRGGATTMGSIMQDLRYGMRSVRSAPGFATVAVVTLALGIAASTATFSVVHAVLLRSLPFQDVDRLVFVWPEANANKAMALLAEERMGSLETVAGMSTWTLTLTGAGDPRELTGLLVSPGYFDLLGVRPVAGRTFEPGEDLPGAAGVVVLSHHLWVSAFGADPGVVGRTVDIGGAEYDARVVVGVMPAGVEDLWDRVDVWVPLEGDPALGLQGDDSWYVNARIARLAPGATLERANAEVRSYATEVQRAVPGQFSPDEAAAATVRPMREYLTRNVRQAVLISLGAAGLVLLIGCFNVANLLLARGDARSRDLAVRAALGAGRSRMTRMLLAEAATLGIAGGAMGVAGAHGLLRVIVAQAPDRLPGGDAISINPAVLLFAVLATVVATIAAGLVPSLRLGRDRSSSALSGGVRGAAGNAAGRLTPVLVSGQIAVAVVVTVGSGLMLRSLTALLAVDPGLDGSGVVALKPTPPAGLYENGEAFRVYYEQVSERIAALPDVESVGGIHLLPGMTSNWSFPTFPDGTSVDPDGQTPSVNFRAVRGDYFRTTRIPLRAGRAVTDQDRADSAPVVMVNEAFVERFWPGESAVGRALSIFSADATRYTVVGVAGDVHQHGRELDPVPEMYFSHGQVPWDQMSMWIVARVRSGDALSAADAVREATWSVDPNVPIASVVDLGEALGESTRTTRFLTLLLSGFGLLALMLAAVGVFGVTSYTTGRRRPEFGVRMALGSSRAEVVRSAASRSLVPVVAGLTVGLITAILSARLLSSMLYGVEPTDPATFLLVAVVLAVTAALAAVVPAWKASRVDPVSVLASD